MEVFFTEKKPKIGYLLVREKNRKGVSLHDYGTWEEKVINKN